jgi:hypothetical protein
LTSFVFLRDSPDFINRRIPDEQCRASPDVLQITSWTVGGTEEIGRKWYYWRTSGTSEVPISSFTQNSLTPSDTNGDGFNDKLVVVWAAVGWAAAACRACSAR